MVTLSEVTLSLLAGSLSTLNPCVFPLLPLVLGGAMQNNRLAPMAMGLGMASSFAILGVLIGLLGDTIGLDTDMVRAAGGWLLVLIGLAMWIPALNERVTRLMTPLASNAQGLSNQLNTQSLISAFALGGVLGFVWSPCSGPLLLSAITLVATEGGLVRGGLVLGLFGLGAAIPLIAVAYTTRAGFLKSRDWLLKYMGGIKKVFASLILILGLLIVTGQDKKLEASLVNLLPQGWVNLTTKY